MAAYLKHCPRNTMKAIFTYTALSAALLFIVATGFDCGKKAGPDQVTPVILPVTTPSLNAEMWLTNADRSSLFAVQTGGVGNFSTNSNSTITVDSATTYQTMDGFGFSLTGGSAKMINSLDATKQEALLKELFLTDGPSIGISYLRISIGASDLSAEDFTYDDVPAGSTDAPLGNFSIDKERTDLIPVLKKIIALNPSIKIVACPWTAPVWMKTGTTGNNGFKGGSLNPAYYDAYAKYFVKYLQAMKAEGINIDAVAPQNEPLNGDNNPSMVMHDGDEGNFIKNNLGPALQAASLTTKIIIYDHNADNVTYALNIFADAAANPYVDGSAWHLYGGNITALSTVHVAYPAKNIYFTEQYTPSTGNFAGDLGWHISNLIIGAPQNWSRNVLEWNLATDPAYGPHTDGGCTTCLGALTISAPNVTRNVSYYIIAHASKFVRPGAVRIKSQTDGSLVNVAFKNTDGTKVLIVFNGGTYVTSFNIKIGAKAGTSTLQKGSVATYVWK